MFAWNFEVDAWSRFWRWNLIKICVWIRDMTSRCYFGYMNSILGSVVPLAMFLKLYCQVHRGWLFYWLLQLAVFDNLSIARFDERYLLVLLGVVPMILGRVVMFPLPGQPLPYYDPGTIGLNSTNNANPPLGGFEGKCKYEWCKHIPAVHIAQFMTGFVIATVRLFYFLMWKTLLFLSKGRLSLLCCPDWINV